MRILNFYIAAAYLSCRIVTPSLSHIYYTLGVSILKITSSFSLIGLYSKSLYAHPVHVT